MCESGFIRFNWRWRGNINIHHRHQILPNSETWLSHFEPLRRGKRKISRVNPSKQFRRNDLSDPEDASVSINTDMRKIFEMKLVTEQQPSLVSCWWRQICCVRNQFLSVVGFNESGPGPPSWFWFSYWLLVFICVLTGCQNSQWMVKGHFHTAPPSGYHHLLLKLESYVYQL